MVLIEKLKIGPDSATVQRGAPRLWSAKLIIPPKPKRKGGLVARTIPEQPVIRIREYCYVLLKATELVEELQDEPASGR